ncbi:MAG TPA: BTAD domain-containing putative transcriptional regulator [Ktedonosporobacter sp.]|nr:BTAD domain-containing putative transcriptional regulator [Ktedonosporobacter sp.]
MIPSLTTSTHTFLQQAETLSQARILELIADPFEQAKLLDLLSMFSSVGQRGAVDPSYVTALYEQVEQEYNRYSHIQQKIQELLTLFKEINAEITLSLSTTQEAPSRLVQETAGLVGEEDRIAQPIFSEQYIDSPALYTVCFGSFTVYHQGVPIKLCSNRNGQAILRFLIAQPDHCASADTLMDLLWPEDPTDVALRKLHVTLSILRNCLRARCSPYDNAILYRHGIYQLNPAITLHSDVEEFLTLYYAGQKASGEVAISYFEKACALYTRPFLMEDLYADWSFSRREQLRQVHLNMSTTLSSHYLKIYCYDTAAHWALEIIKENPCDESAHRQLMRIYAIEGRRNDALRQYQHCQRLLHEELNLPPMPETKALYHAIQRGDLDMVKVSL